MWGFDVPATNNLAQGGFKSGKRSFSPPNKALLSIFIALPE
jgi:hypothetical protein